jgi:hypothetical protein
MTDIAPLSSQHGFDLAALKENELHPEQTVAWEKRRTGLKAAHAKTNELVAEVNALKKALAERPF